MKIIFIALILCTSIYSQQNLDSLIADLSNKPDTTKVKILTDYTWTNRSKDPSAALRSGQEAYRIAQKIKNKSLQAKALNLIGVVYRNLANYDRSLNVYRTALKLAEEVKDSLQIAYSYNNIGGIYRLEGNNILALEYILKALSIFENLKNKEGMSFCTINIGLIYRRQNNYIKALEYLNYTLRLREEINDRPGKALALNLIAEVHYDMGSMNAALNYYYEVEKEYIAVDDKKGIAAAWGGIAGVFYNQKNYLKALEYRKKSLELSQKISYIEGQVNNHINLGLIYAQLGNFNEADNHFAEALKIAESMKEIYVQIDTYKNLAKYYEIRNNQKDALKYFKKYTALKDSVLNEENISMLAEMEAVYKNERAEKEKSVLSKDLELKEKQRNYLIVIVLLILAIALITFSRYHSKKLANEKLQELNAVKDTFFRLIAHDLKTPFNAIFGYTEILKEDFKDLSDEEKLTFIDDIGKAAKQNYQLLENLLMWSQSQSGRLEFNPIKINFKEILSETFNLLMPSAKNKNINLTLKCEKDFVINADKQMVTTVLRNLISNGIKFTYEGGTVTVSVENESNNLKIAVEDTGTGIDGKTLKNLFHLDKISTKNGTHGEKGTGLGLVLCKDFIERHNGKIWAESEPGKGSKFLFTLPV